MQEFELYVPVPDEETKAFTVQGLQDRLRKRFGGYTYFPQETQGEWETGGQRFKDRIVILRVLTADTGATQWFQELGKELAVALEQSDFLITVRAVERVETIRQ